MTEVFLQRIILQKNFPKKCWPGFRYYYFHGSRDPFILLNDVEINWQEATFNSSETLSKFAQDSISLFVYLSILYFSTVSMIIIEAEIRPTCSFWRAKQLSSLTCHTIFEPCTSGDDSEVWEQVLFENFRTSFLENKKKTLSCSSIFSKSNVTFNKMFKFKKLGILFELLLYGEREFLRQRGKRKNKQNKTAHSIKFENK